MKKSALVSIVMSTYNNAPYLREAIESARKQTLKNWELIIINDASTDNTDEILKKYVKKDRRIVYIKNRKNIGATRNANKGINVAKGKFIARLDGDDYWTDKTKLRQQIDFLIKNSEYGMVGSYAKAVDTSGKKTFSIKYPRGDASIRNILLKHSCFVHSSVLIRKDLLLKVKKYNVKHLYAQDYDLYLKMGTVSKLHNIPKFMVNYRINPEGVSRTKYLIQNTEIIKIISEYKKHYSGYLFGFLLWNIRRFYPVWFRGSLSRQIKKKIGILYKLSGT